MWSALAQLTAGIAAQELMEYRIVSKVVKVAALIFNLEYHYECFHSQS